jgi:hypothetical protein
MSTGTLQPHENAELLRIAAATRGLRQRDDPGAFAQAKRDLILATMRQPLLVAHRGGSPARIPGPQGGLLAGFTDEEAAQAWTAVQHPEAPHYEFTLAPEQHQGSERKLWLELLERNDVTAVLINPAGPLAFVAHVDEYRGTRPRLLRKKHDQSGEPWLDPKQRAIERARVQQRLLSLEEVVASDDGRDYWQLRDEPPALNRIGSLAVASAEELLNGRWLMEHGDTQKGMQHFLFGAYSWGRHAGDPYRCIDALLRGGELLLRLGNDSIADGEQPGWTNAYLNELANALALMQIGYRQPEAERFAEWRTAAGGAP